MDINEKSVQINVDVDIVTARQEGRALASRLGFSSSEQVLIATQFQKPHGIYFSMREVAP